MNQHYSRKRAFPNRTGKNSGQFYASSSSESDFLNVVGTRRIRALWALEFFLSRPFIR